MKSNTFSKNTAFSYGKTTNSDRTPHFPEEKLRTLTEHYVFLWGSYELSQNTNYVFLMENYEF